MTASPRDAGLGVSCSEDLLSARLGHSCWRTRCPIWAESRPLGFVRLLADFVEKVVTQPFDECGLRQPKAPHQARLGASLAKLPGVLRRGGQEELISGAVWTSQAQAIHLQIRLRCPDSASIFLPSRSDVMQASVFAMSRAKFLAPSWIERRIWDSVLLACRGASARSPACLRGSASCRPDRHRCARFGGVAETGAAACLPRARLDTCRDRGI